MAPLFIESVKDEKNENILHLNIKSQKRNIFLIFSVGIIIFLYHTPINNVILKTSINSDQ